MSGSASASDFASFSAQEKSKKKKKVKTKSKSPDDEDSESVAASESVDSLGGGDESAGELVSSKIKKKKKDKDKDKEGKKKKNKNNENNDIIAEEEEEQEESKAISEVKKKSKRKTKNRESAEAEAENELSPETAEGEEGKENDRDTGRSSGRSALSPRSKSARPDSLAAFSSTASANRFLNSAQQQALEDRVLLTSLLESQQFGGAVKAVFDRQWQGRFTSITRENVEQRENQIREICNENYQEFISSVDHLLSVKLDLHELRSSVATLNKSIQDSGAQLIASTESLSAARQARIHLNQAREAILNCQFLIQLAAKVSEQIACKKYFSALKSLDQLQKLHLPRFGSLPFARHLEGEIPVWRSTIQSSVKREFLDWMARIREKSSELGSAALKQMEKMVKIEENQRARRRKLREREANDGETEEAADEEHSDREDESDAGSESDGDGAADRHMPDEDVFDQVSINFAPVYQCLHIYEQLSIGDQFIALYKEKRRQHAIQTVEIKENMKIAQRSLKKGSAPETWTPQEIFDEFFAYFSHFCGFFIVEDSVVKSGTNLISLAEVQAIWQLATNKVHLVITEQITLLTSVEQFLSLHSAVRLLCQCLGQYGYDVQPFKTLLWTHKGEFEKLLRVRMRADLRDIFAIEKFEPLLIHNEKEFAELVLAYELQGDLMNVEFPLSMPFSLCVPLFIRVIRQFVHDFAHFCIGTLSDKEFLPAILRATDSALIEEINSSLNALLDSTPSIQISQAVQFSVNAQTMADACKYLEKFAASFCEDPAESGAGPSMPITGSAAVAGFGFSAHSLSARQSFQQTRIRCEDLLFELINQKLDDFLTIATHLDWAPSESNAQPHDFIPDLINYLMATFSGLSSLPEAVRSAVHFTSCKHLAEGFMSGFATGSIKKFNLLGMWNFSLDLKEIYQFAGRCEIPNLQETLSEPMQLVEFFLGNSGDIEDFLNPDIRQARFPHLSSAKLLKILDKFKDLGLFTKAPQNIKKVTRKQVDALVKKMKTSGQ